MTTAIQINPEWLIKQDEHTKAFRWYWFTRGVEIKTNGQIKDARGKYYVGVSYEQVAREYAR
jgi:hypothetical protein